MINQTKDNYVITDIEQIISNVFFYP